MVSGGRSTHPAAKNDSKECPNVSLANVGLPSLDLPEEQHQIHRQPTAECSPPVLGCECSPIDPPSRIPAFHPPRRNNRWLFEDKKHEPPRGLVVGNVGTHDHTLAQARQAQDLLFVEHVEDAIGILLHLHKDVLALVRKLRPGGMGESIQ